MYRSDSGYAKNTAWENGFVMYSLVIYILTDLVNKSINFIKQKTNLVIISVYVQ